MARRGGPTKLEQLRNALIDAIKDDVNLPIADRMSHAQRLDYTKQILEINRMLAEQGKKFVRGVMELGIASQTAKEIKNTPQPVKRGDALKD